MIKISDSLKELIDKLEDNKDKWIILVLIMAMSKKNNEIDRPVFPDGPFVSHTTSFEDMNLSNSSTIFKFSTSLQKSSFSCFM